MKIPSNKLWVIVKDGGKLHFADLDTVYQNVADVNKDIKDFDRTMLLSDAIHELTRRAYEEGIDDTIEEGSVWDE